MKLHLPMLERIIALPTQDQKELRLLFDDLGLEVKDIDTSAGYPVFNIETLANRGDHLSALGVARELSARFLTPLKLPQVVSELPAKTTAMSVRNESDKCSRYYLMEMTLGENLTVSSEVRSVIPEAPDRPAIVDYLNYIQLEIGQPMHAFDLEKVEGEVVVRLSDKEQEIVALDHKSYKVPAGSLVICDRNKIIAVAGVIGCENTMCTASTRKVLIESAAFDPVSVRLTARKMGISTDASYTFERGSDREAIIYSLKRLAFLTKGSAGTVSGDSGAHALAMAALAGKPTEERKVSITLKKIRHEMNLARLAMAELKGRLQYLGYKITEQDDELSCTVPSWRLWDVAYDADLVEDFARSHGYNNVKQELPALDYEAALPCDQERLLEQLEPILLGNGFFEVISDAFTAPEDVKLLEELQPGITSEHVRIKNAVESACSFVKSTNLIHFANLAEFNLKRGVPAIKIFEIGRLFGVAGPNAKKGADKDAENLYEREVLSIAVAGRWYENEFKKGESTEDLLLLTKGLIEGLCRSLGSELSVGESEHKLLHPGRQASIKLGRLVAGVLGVIHPILKQKLGLKQDLIYCELDCETLLKVMKEREFKEPSEFPSVKRDITLKMEQRTHADKVVSFVNELKLESLNRVEIVDDFKREGEEFRRVSYRLQFQRVERTLESAEVDSAMEQVLSHLKTKHALELA